MSTVTTTGNPTINISGTAEIAAGQNCAWTTNSDGNATMSVTNISRENQCKLSISGAPSDATVTVSGSSEAMNGIFTIPSNSPNYSIDCFGDYGGSIITITNITNSQNDATANIACNKA